jgi:flagellar hook-basal body complex protein FliE
MSAISPISGSSALSAYAAAQAASKPAGDGGQFGQLLSRAVGAVNDQQQAGAQAIQDLLAGRSDDVLSVVTAMAKADLSFKLLLGVRNKVIEAYKQTMNMQL